MPDCRATYSSKPSSSGSLGMMVAIPTSGRVSRLKSTLESLARCKKPDTYLGTIVIENGRQLGAHAISKEFQERLNASYLHYSEANKSGALNHLLENIQSNVLLFLTDDDVELDTNVLTEIANAAGSDQSGVVLGGRLKIKSTISPPKRHRTLMPYSLSGFPSEGQDMSRLKNFVGANWAAYSADLLRLKGFDPRFGPGSKLNATGQESQMMRRMREQGFEFRFVSDAIVTHHVDAERYNRQFLIQRRYRNGVEAGITAIDQSHGGCTWTAGKALVKHSIMRRILPLVCRVSRRLWGVETTLRYRGRLQYSRGFIRAWRAEKKQLRFKWRFYNPSKLPKASLPAEVILPVAGKSRGQIEG